MKREELKQHAQMHYADIKVRLKEETNHAITNSEIFGPNLSFPAKPRETYHNTFYLKDQDSVSCLFSLTDRSKTAILNYASYKHPGGYFLGGSSAQEEALCHESNLYPILLAFDDTYYAWNRQRLNRALYLNRAIYTPDVVFEKDNNRKLADVITCASPNYRTAHTYQQIPLDLNNRTMEERINFMYQIAEAKGVENLIAGAWGCGVFMQDPSTVATLLVSAARNYNIPNIYFAIPDRNSRNFKAFLEVLQKKCTNN